MKSDIFNLIKDTATLSWQQIVSNVLVAGVFGFLIFASYMISHRGTIYSKKFNVSLVTLTVLTSMVMTVIGNNVALSLGMVGALSIVRFRTAIKDSRDTVYIFWTIIVGICCGVGDYLVAGAGSILVFLILLGFGAIKSSNRMLIIIRAGRKKESMIQALMADFFDYKAVMRVKNSTEESIEFIYEVTSKLLSVAQKNKNVGLCDEIYKLGDIQYVNIVMQNDEISN